MADEILKLDSTNIEVQAILKPIVLLLCRKQNFYEREVI